MGTLMFMDHTSGAIESVKKVPLELVESDVTVTIGASHGWVATLKEDGILRLQDDLNPVESDKYPKRIPLPSLVTLPHCQTQIVTNVAMSSSSPEDENCVVAIKFLGPQLSFCKPSQPNSEWTNVRIENLCFHSLRVMFSKKDEMFSIVGSGGNLIGSWDLQEHLKKPKLQRLRFQNVLELTKTKQELLHSCITREHLVESITTGETFLVKFYRKATTRGKLFMKTRAVMLFKLDGEGNVVYTEDIGDLTIFISKNEPFCVDCKSFLGVIPNRVESCCDDELVNSKLPSSYTRAVSYIIDTPYYIPPQNIN